MNEKYTREKIAEELHKYTPAYILEKTNIPRSTLCKLRNKPNENVRGECVLEALNFLEEVKENNDY